MISLLLYTTIYIGFILFVILIYKGIFFENYKHILPYIFLTAIASFYEGILTDFTNYHVHTKYWFLIYNFFEFFCVYFFFKKIIERIPNLYFFSFLVIFLINFFLTITIRGFENGLFLNTIVTLPTTLFVLISSILWFKQRFEINITDDFLLSNPNFFIVTGLFFYQSSTFILFLLSDYIFKANLNLQSFWIINILACLILRLLLIISTWKLKKV